ncbi:MAG: flagellar motor switch protein FliN [Armatimonadetes bacterium]|nr:flagellar motor switch protein FliN [Armatimonadota bacterium]
MPDIAPEIISKFSAYQPQIWQNVAVAVSEAAAMQVNFDDALTVSAAVSDLYSEMNSPKLIIQFAFASHPDNTQVILIGQETLSDMYEAFTGKQKETIDESAVSEIRPAFEAIVQGMCLGAGNLRNEAMVASGLTIRMQIFSFPQNMQHVQNLVRTNVRISAEGLNGSFIWLVDEPVASMLVGMGEDDEQPEEDESPFGAMENAGATAHAGGSSGSKILEDNGLEMLMDIPLEVSVELGRVKMVVKDVVELGSGSIVEIDKAAGEPVDVMVNGRLVARGEVVVIEDNFGVRITEILSPAERLAKLNEVA